MRCFVAIELEPALHGALARLLAESCSRDREVRWCTPNQLHLTLKFLGEIEDTLLPRICEVVGAISASASVFHVRLTRLGCFPSPRAPRVMWCGVDDPASGCRRWVEAADPRFAELGIPREERTFTPHITLGRSKAPGGARVMQRVLDVPVKLPDTPIEVRQVTVFESRLLPTGAQYRAVYTASLGTGG